MTDTEWAAVPAALPVPAWLEGRGGQPEGYCHPQMVDAVRYLVAGGITWRAMPADFPAWDRVYAFFRRWRDRGWTAEFHDRLRDRIREAAGRGREPTAGIIDAQSVKAAASVPTATRGFDGGKRVNGRKRHIVVDTLGLLLAVVVTAASVTDRDAGRTLLTRLRERYWRITLVWADGGYTGQLVEFARNVLRIALTVVKRSDDTTGFVVLPKRWLVERTFAWLMRSRRAARSRSSNSPITDVIRHLHQRDDTTPRPCHRNADPVPDQRKHTHHDRKDNGFSGKLTSRRTTSPRSRWSAISLAARSSVIAPKRIGSALSRV
ncbi:IS5 family transposase [Streptomyces sp. NPDC002073]